MPEPNLDDRYFLQQLTDGEWQDWSEKPVDYFRAQQLAALARKYHRTVRVVDALGQEVK